MKHGHCANGRLTPTYSSWAAMRARCLNPNHHAAHRYSERGITITKRWDDFTAFLHDIGERPEGTTLERVDNDLGYFKENCIWLPRDKQYLNTRLLKLTFEKATAIALRSLYGETHASIAFDYEVTSPTVTLISNGNTWKGALKEAKKLFQSAHGVRGPRLAGQRKHLTFDDAVNIAIRRFKGETAKSIAADYGVSISLPQLIAKGWTWKGAAQRALQIIGPTERENVAPELD